MAYILIALIVAFISWGLAADLHERENANVTVWAFFAWIYPIGLALVGAYIWLVT